MIKQRGDKMWTAHCDKPGCPEVTDSFLTYTDIMLDLMNKKWSFCDSKSPCFCQTCSGKFKEKEKPVCVARDKEFAYDWVTFYTEVAHCPRANLLFPYPPCPASTFARWKCGGKKYSSMDNLFLYLDKSPEFLAACSKCLGEGEVEKEAPPLHIGKAGVEIRVQRANEKKCHPSCQFYLPRQYAPSWCNRHDELCLAGYRCENCLKEFPLGEVASESVKEVETPGIKIIDDIAVMLSDEYRCHPYCSFYSTPAFDPWCKRFDSWCVGGRRCQKCINKYPTPVVDAEVTVNDQIDLLEKRVNKITEGYERMFSYLDIISKAVMTFIREKEEKK